MDEISNNVFPHDRVTFNYRSILWLSGDIEVKKKLVETVRSTSLLFLYLNMTYPSKGFL